MSKRRQPLKGMKVFFSASVPECLENQAQEKLVDLMVLARWLFAAGGEIVYGGHPSITPVIHQCAQQTGVSSNRIHLFQLRRFRHMAPEEIWDPEVFSKIHWIGDGDRSLAEELGTMRDAMAEASHAAVFMGGKRGPGGIRDEYERFLSRHGTRRPMYLLGFLDGLSKDLIEEHEKAGTREPNGLAPRDLAFIRHNKTMEIIAPLIIGDMARYGARSEPATGKWER